MPTEEDALFRREALVFRSAHSDGGPRVITPPGAGLVCLILVFAAAATLAFLTHNDYARKATVTGYIEPGGSIKRILTPRPGVLEKILVHAGQAVSKGETLAEILVSAAIDQRDRQTLLDELDAQAEAINQRTHETRTERILEDRRLRSELNHARRSLGHVERVLNLQQQKVEQLQQIHEAARPLFDRGQLSKLEWGRFNESLLDARQALERLVLDQSDGVEKSRQLEMALEALAPAFATRLSILEQEASRIHQSRVALVAESRLLITATVDGHVANFFVQEGTPIASAQPIVSILPTGAPLYARLLIPSRSAGFVAPGQNVNLLYDAFPYQQFGSYRARMISISSHALLPGDLPNATAMREPFFEAVAEIESPFVDAYGDQVPLRSGMTLSADVVLDRRTLIDWILEPLYVMRGRSL